MFQDPSRLLSSNFETSVRATHLTIIKLFESLETNLTLLGATGVEDQLQQDVPFVIRELRSCGLHCWVLTGDKPETVSERFILVRSTLSGWNQRFFRQLMWDTRLSY